MSFSYLTAAECTDTGRKRKHNEDALVSFPDHGIFLVADGMGGAAGGEVASRAVVDALRKELESMPSGEAAAGLTERVRATARAFGNASCWIKNRADDLGVSGTGTTAVAIVFDQWRPERAVALHVGDSRAYQVRRGKLTQLTKDHSVAAAAGVRETSIPAIFRGVVTRAVGLEKTVAVDQTPVWVAPGDMFLICSDGLTKMISDGAVAKMLSKRGTGDVAVLARNLVDAANQAGGDDNVSVILLRVANPLPPARPGAPDDPVEIQTLVFPEPQPVDPAGTRPTPGGASTDEHPSGPPVLAGETPTGLADAPTPATWKDGAGAPPEEPDTPATADIAKPNSLGGGPDVDPGPRAGNARPPVRKAGGLGALLRTMFGGARSRPPAETGRDPASGNSSGSTTPS